MAVLALVAVSGCGLNLGSGGCVDTAIEAEDAAVDDETVPLTLTARLTADGEPVEGAELSFAIHKERDGEVVVRPTGSESTDADGVAEQVHHGGSRDLPAVRTDEVIGYSVSFRPFNRINGVRYCDSRSGRVGLDVPCAGFACRW